MQTYRDSVPCKLDISFHIIKTLLCRHLKGWKRVFRCTHIVSSVGNALHQIKIHFFLFHINGIETGQHHGCLCTGGVIAWKQSIVGSRHQTNRYRPVHRRNCPVGNSAGILKTIDISIKRRILGNIILVNCVPIEDCRHLFPGNGIIGLKPSVIITGNDIILFCPGDCAGIPVTDLNIRIGRTNIQHPRASILSVKTLNKHCSCNGDVRRERVVGCSHHQFPVDHILHRTVKPVSPPHILQQIRICCGDCGNQR